jgi:hypothetical protein
MTGAVTPLLGPDGQVHNVPNEQVPQALSSGGKVVSKMYDPQGTLHWVTDDQKQAALAAGGTPYSPDAACQLQQQDQSNTRQMLVSGLTGMPTPNMTPDQQQQFQQGKAAGAITATCCSRRGYRSRTRRAACPQRRAVGCVSTPGIARPDVLSLGPAGAQDGRHLRPERRWRLCGLESAEESRSA